MTRTRQLSPSERAVWLMDQAAPCNGVQVAHVRGPLGEAALRAGLAHAQARHPLLRARVVPGPRPAYQAGDGTGPVPLRVVPRAGAETAMAVMEEELNLPFAPDQAPLWRAVLVAPPGPPQAEGEREVVLAHHHVLADALSAAYHLRDVLTAAAAAGEGRPLPPGGEDAIAPALAERLPMSAWRALGCMRRFVVRNAAARLHGAPRRLRLDARPPPAERRTRPLHLALTAAQTAALSARAREAGTTVQGALGAALLRALAPELDPPPAAGERATVGMFSAVNLRDHLRPPVGEALGLYVSQATTYHRIVQDRAAPLWELAREVKAGLDQAVAAGDPYMTFPWLGLFVPRGPDPVPGLVRRIDLAAPVAAGLTNVGRLPVPERYGPLVLHKLHIAIGVALVAPLVLAAVTAAGALTCNLLHVEPLLSRPRAQGIGERLLSALLEDA